MSKKKILWFVPGATTPELKALAKTNGLTIRNPLAYSDGAGLEDCDAVTGMVPNAYADNFQVIDEPEGCSWQAASQPQYGQAAEDGSGKVKAPGIDDLRAALTAKNITFDPKAKKPDLQKLLDEASAAEELKAKLKGALTEKSIQFEPDADLKDLQKLLDEAK
ncbi:HeH/LEM domain-containing protein [Pseudomonas chlororaphis subsp. piscium]|nr:HeH/LEM domain-containing protein [Pseudomonas chlororaphis subsp. piscium]